MQRGEGQRDHPYADVVGIQQDETSGSRMPADVRAYYEAH